MTVFTNMKIYNSKLFFDDFFLVSYILYKTLIQFYIQTKLIISKFIKIK